MNKPSAPSSRRIPAGAADLAPGECRIVETGTGSIGLYLVDGRFYAIRNHCPHEGAELCRGKLTGTTLPTDTLGQYQWGRENLILRCPWHQWEFDLETGRHLANPACRVRTYRVVAEEGQLFLEL